MTGTELDWDMELTEVDEARTRDTLPAPPPTEPDHEPPPHPRCGCVAFGELPLLPSVCCDCGGLR